MTALNLSRVAIVFAVAIAVPASALADGIGGGYSSGSYTPPAVSSGSYVPSYSSGSYKPTGGYSSGSYVPSYSSGSYKPTTYSSGSYVPSYSSGSYKPVTYSSGSYKPSTYSTKPYTYNTYKPSYDYKYDYKPYTYSYPSYDYYYPSYYGGYGGSSGFSFTYNENDNSNSNSNVNNNVITVGGGETVRTVYIRDHDDDDDNDDLWCDLEVSPSRIDDGEEADLIWDVRGATYASINQGIGRVDEDGGREEVDPSRDTTYRLTVRNNDGDEETCSATLRVDDDRNTFSSTVFTDEPVQNPPQVVYLSSLPYTGLDDISPAVLTYWFLLIAAIGGAFWYALSKGLIGRPRYAFAEVDGIPEVPVVETPDTSDFVTAVEEGNEEAALDALREAAVAGVGVEEYLREARLQVSDATLAARLDDAIVQAEQTGIRGAKQALFA